MFDPQPNMERNRTSVRSELAEHRASWAGQQQQHVEAAPMLVDGANR